MLQINFIGYNVIGYLKKIITYMDQNNIECNVSDKVNGQFEIVLSDFLGRKIELLICCTEISMKWELNELLGINIDKNSWYFVILPVKCFPALRYNIDEDWNGIENWATPIMYKRKFNEIGLESSRLIWIFQGIECIQLTNDFFQRAENKVIMNIKNLTEWGEKEEEIKNIICRFLEEIGEKKYWEKEEWLYVGFFKNKKGGALVGEKTDLFWTMYPMLRLLKANGFTLFD